MKRLFLGARRVSERLWPLSASESCNPVKNTLVPLLMRNTWKKENAYLTCFKGPVLLGIHFVIVF